VPYLVEETYEVVDALAAGNVADHREELGDLLLQVIFQSELRFTEGAFGIDDVARGIVAKLVRRHPHVFGDVHVDSADQVLVNWERIKTVEKGQHPVDDDIPATLPALARASKVQRRAAGSGFDWRTRDAAMAKVREELAELESAPPERAEEELGDLLFAVAAVGRRFNVDPETALRKATDRFAARFERMRATAGDDGLELEGLSDQELLERFRAAR
jgi:MazG family protein